MRCFSTVEISSKRFTRWRFLKLRILRIHRIFGLKGRNKSAQGIALGFESRPELAGRIPRPRSSCEACYALTGLGFASVADFPGRCPGLICYGPFGAQRIQNAQLQNLRFGRVLRVRLPAFIRARSASEWIFSPSVRSSVKISDQAARSRTTQR